MLKGWQYWLLTGISVVAGALVLTNMWLFTGNRGLQGEVNARAQYLAQTGQLEVLYREMVKALADLAVKSNDDQLRQMLGSQGITINAGAGPAVVPEGKGREGR